MRRLPRSILWLAALCVSWLVFIVVATIRHRLGSGAGLEFRESHQLVAALQESLELKASSLPQFSTHALWIVPTLGLAGIGLRWFQQRWRNKRS